MPASDTNVLVFLITWDDKKQVDVAEAFAAEGRRISHLVMVEISFVLEPVYDPTREEIAIALEMLLDRQHLCLQDLDVVVAAVGRLEDGQRL